jgi:hypothetical protein
MPLPLPNLDDRRWIDLVQEGRALIPRHSPNWTDHNIHDPGITLIELFAWLTEISVYRLNRVPERHTRKFLALIGFTPLPPRAAQTFLTFNPDPGTGPFLLPEGTEFEAVDAANAPVPFRTLRDLDVAVVKLAAVQVADLDSTGKLVIRDRTEDWRDGVPIAALGLNPQHGAALYLGFSELPTQIPVSLAFRFSGPGNDSQERSRIIEEAAAQRAACRPVLPDIHCEGEVVETDQVSHVVLPHHSARITWEVFTGAAPDNWKELKAVTMPVRPNVGEVADDTRSLTLDGIVEVNVPTTIIRTTLGEVTTNLFYLRGTLTSGAYDAPPLLVDIAPNGVFAEQAVPVSQSFTVPAGVTPVGPAPTDGTITRLIMQLHASSTVKTLTFDPAAVGAPDVLVINYQAPSAVSGQITLELTLVGIGDGRPRQRMSLRQSPVQVESLRLFTHANNLWFEWLRRDDFDASVRTDFHFVLDPMSGEITFGDGERGRVPPEDCLVLAMYRATRADFGNVDAHTITQPSDTPRNSMLLDGLPAPVRDQLSRITTNRAPATGGTASEDLSATIGRAVETLHAHERLLDLCAETKCQTLDQIDSNRVHAIRAPTRAVNLLDIERLTRDVPGTRIARARAWPAVHPGYPCLKAPGVVTVVVIPNMPGAKPEPSPGLLEAVKRYLDRRRMVCTRVEVVGPNYLDVRVRASVRTRPHTDAARVRTQILQALNAFFDPVTGGPGGGGWPFGRDVYRSEILQLIDGVPGVDHVLELSLSTPSGEPQCGNVPLCPNWLVTSGMHQIEINSPFPDGRTLSNALRECPSPETNNEPFD